MGPDLLLIEIVWHRPCSPGGSGDQLVTEAFHP